jgi:thiol:disulfide interchange protein
MGTLIARIIGLSRSAGLIAVGIGAGLAVVVYALTAQLVGSQWPTLIQSPWVIACSVLVLGAFAWIAWRYVRAELSRG